MGYTLPAADLRPFVTTYSLTEVAAGAPDVHDQVYPEWANVRFSANGAMAAGLALEPLRPCHPICAIGPTSHSTRFTLGPGRYWTVSLTPLGWVRFMGIPASAMADRWELVVPGSAFERFAPLLACDARGEAPATTVAAIDALLLGLVGEPMRAGKGIETVHAALLDPDVTAVSQIADRSGLTIRSIERLAKAAFGFGPKLLLRRQRFLRSLSLFMRDPSLAWIDTLDSQYTDQAHFIRDFRRFMDETPGAYAARPHPVLRAAVAARIAAAGAAMQVLQSTP